MTKLSNAEEAWIVAENELRATKQVLHDFQQRVSDAVESLLKEYPRNFIRDYLDQFIIPKPDPLIEIFDECFNQDVLEGETWSEAMARKTRAAMDARGLKIVEEENDG